MRGGYRPGSGPRKGAIYKTRKKVPESEQKENVKLMLLFHDRLMDGGTLTNTEIKQLEAMEWGLTTAEEKQLEEFKILIKRP